MKNFVGSLLSLVAFTGASSWAVPANLNLKLDEIPSIENQVQEEVWSREGVEELSDFGLSGIYKFRKPVELTPLTEVVDGYFYSNLAGETLGFNLDEPVYIEFDLRGNAVIHLHLVEEEQGLIPEMIFIPARELEKADLEFIQAGDEKVFAKDYTAYEETQEASGTGYSRKGRLHYRGASGCVAYVMRALNWRGPRLGNGHAVTGTLMRNGWKRLASCKNPPVGAVASWSGGSHGLGHTGIWNGKGWCYDKGCADPGRKYRFLNCVQRPSGKKKK